MSANVLVFAVDAPYVMGSIEAVPANITMRFLVECIGYSANDKQDDDADGKGWIGGIKPQAAENEQ